MFGLVFAAHAYAGRRRRPWTANCVKCTIAVRFEQFGARDHREATDIPDVPDVPDVPDATELARESRAEDWNAAVWIWPLFACQLTGP